MASTPIYNWPTPDNSDLVKNGALAMRTLGDAIDTTMATMTPKSIVDAKGDLIAASAADTPARLAVGANGETLVADSSTATGLRYTAGTVQSNPILNSAFQVWQRGTSISVPSAFSTYAADRFQVFNAGANEALTVARQATNDTTNLPFIQYCTRVQRNSGQTGTTLTQYGQTLESINSIPYAGKTITFSFYARAGANFSAASNTLAYSVQSGTGTDQNVFTGFTGATNVIAQPATLTTTWQRFAYSGTVAATATQLGFQVAYTPTGTAGANDYYEVTGFQIDIGSVALPFRTYAGTIQGELAACQRYYWRSTATESGYSRFPGFGLFDSTTNAQTLVQPPVTMRTKPTSVDYSTLGLYDGVSVLGITAWAITAGNAYSWCSNVTVASGGVAKQSVQVTANNSGSAYLGFSAEL